MGRCKLDPGLKSTQAPGFKKKCFFRLKRIQQQCSFNLNLLVCLSLRHCDEALDVEDVLADGPKKTYVGLGGVVQA